MRIFYLILLVVFLLAITIFAVQNQSFQELQFLGMQLAAPLSLIIAAAYVLGMLTGWTVVGFLRRSVRHVTHHHEKQQP